MLKPAERTRSPELPDLAARGSPQARPCVARQVGHRLEGKQHRRSADAVCGEAIEVAGPAAARTVGDDGTMRVPARGSHVQADDTQRELDQTPYNAHFFPSILSSGLQQGTTSRLECNAPHTALYHAMLP
jgi:hypothetical protein